MGVRGSLQAGIISVGESVEQGGYPMSIFSTTIVLATDGSEEAELAARTAVDLAGKTGSDLHVVDGLNLPPETLHDPFGAAARGDFARRGRP